MKNISILGLGYIGLPTAIISAQAGYQVFGFDTDKNKIEKINSFNPLICEPEIEEKLYTVLQNKSFKAYNILQPADIFIIAVPTPFKENKKADLSYVFSATEIIAEKIIPGNLVILESTVPVGTTYKIAKILEEKTGLKTGTDFFVAHCPERVLPGKIFQELILNSRIIGGICEQSTELAKTFYSKFVKGELFLTDDKTAEMVKLIENSSRDVQIALANQIAGMCESVGINPFNVINLANKHPRVKILNPSCGVGGHCIAVDPWFLVESFPENSLLLKTAREINDSKPENIIKKVKKKAKLLITKPAKVLALGLTFKQDIDDLRESPALKIALKLNQDNLIDLAVLEPNISQEKLKNLGLNNIFNIKNFQDHINWADIILILVNHKQFFDIKNLNLLNKEIIDSSGLLYFVNQNNNSFFNDFSHLFKLFSQNP